MPSRKSVAAVTKDHRIRAWPGKPYPLGASWDGAGVNFALFSQHAERVELCIFPSARSRKESHRINMLRSGGDIWHVYLPDLSLGTVYGYRVYGDYDPEGSGFRFNPHKVLLDPYAKLVARDPVWHRALFGYDLGNKGQADLSLSKRDSAAFAPLAQVIDADFDWGGDKPPNVPWPNTIIYEVHVKGISQTHPKVPPKLRGTFAGLASEPIIKHLTSLGITTVELLPIHHHVDEGHLVDKDLTNYWGYSTLSYFAPDRRYASGNGRVSPVREFKEMVRTLHAAGIEVILDVVYNHTGEGNQLGPTLSFRGIDNPSYYRLQTTEPRYYADYTGCGNTLNTQHPRVLQLIMDSLRYWVEEMHVDGFRFDLTTALSRESHAVDYLGGFFDVIQQDPVVSQVKLIAEPWDLGEDGYQVGNFPYPWREWNDKFRGTLRSFWRGDRNLLGRMATRISGNSDLYSQGHRGPNASVNFVTCHDGFTLGDLVSYSQKHNRANGEQNRDGENHNFSWNCGVEGPSRKTKVQELRLRQRKNLMASLILSIGVPMISGGDELGRTQKGNNNAYCQDNSISWFNWRLTKDDREFLDFVCELICIRKERAVFRRQSFFPGRVVDPRSKMKDIGWYGTDGEELTSKDWHNPDLHALAVLIAGRGVDETNERGVKSSGDSMLLLFNADSRNTHITLPHNLQGSSWELILDTAIRPSVQHKKFSRLKKSYNQKAHSLVLLKVI